jgi:hypothetical protein
MRGALRDSEEPLHRASRGPPHRQIAGRNQPSIQGGFGICPVASWSSTAQRSESALK